MTGCVRTAIPSTSWRGARSFAGSEKATPRTWPSPPISTPKVDGDRLRIYVLPDEAWSRRVSGTMGNELVRQGPDLAYAVLVPNTADCYMVTVRAPATRPQRADDFCRRFDTGGGRAAAAGINHLPRVRLDDFVRLFQESFS